MVIGGFQKTSLSDFPGVISSIVFTRGCSLRCPYCHNPELVDPARYAAALPWETVKRHLQSRAGRIEGVVVTGGEPTVHADLLELLAEIRSMGLKVKLDTNGTNPQMLRQAVHRGLLDYVAMDLKAPLELYDRVAGVSVDTAAVSESLAVVRACGLPHEIRTTFAPAVLSLEGLLRMTTLLSGFRRVVIQAFRSGKTLDPRLAAAASPTQDELKQVVSRFAAAGISVEIR